MTDTQRKIDPLDVEALEKSLNDSATRVSAIWISYLAFGLYLLAATINVSHRQLFLADAMKLPVLGIDLPLFGFFLFAPLLFVIFHVYVLVQLLLLSRTALAYNDAVDSALTSAEDRTRIRQRLANTLFAQLLAGSPREREGLLGVILKVMALATLAVAPLLILLAFQIQFLPYHSTTITWAHRLFIIADWAAVLMFWPAIMNPQREIETRLLKRPASAAPTIILVLFVVLVPSFPGEPQAPLTRAGRYFIPPSESKSPHCNGRSWFEWLMPNNFDRISLPGEDLIEDDKIARAAKVRRLGRRFASQAGSRAAFKTATSVADGSSDRVFVMPISAGRSCTALRSAPRISKAPLSSARSCRARTSSRQRCRAPVSSARTSKARPYILRSYRAPLLETVRCRVQICPTDASLART